MRHGLTRGAYRPTSQMNVTPLVDVVLVLLIIFMVVIPVMEKAAKVDLPSVFNADPKPRVERAPYTLSITTNGDTFLEQEKLHKEPAQFLARLRAANDADPRRPLLLRADRGAKYGDVRGVFKVCQDVGFPGLSLRVNELKPGG